MGSDVGDLWSFFAPGQPVFSFTRRRKAFHAEAGALEPAAHHAAGSHLSDSVGKSLACPFFSSL
jgi:hypothetical protein